MTADVWDASDDWSFAQVATGEVRTVERVRAGYGKGVSYARVNGRGIIFVTTPGFFVHALDQHVPCMAEDVRRIGDPVRQVHQQPPGQATRQGGDHHGVVLLLWPRPRRRCPLLCVP